MNSLINNNINIGGRQNIENLKTLIFGGSDAKALDIKDNVLEVAAAPTTTRARRVTFTDKDGNRVAELQSTKDTSGNQQFMILASNAVSGSTINAGVSVVVDSNGTAYGKSPASDAVGAIVTQSAINKSSDGYLKFGNSIMLQWGASGSAQSGTVTLPTPYTSTNYRISTAITVAVNEPRTIGLSDKTSTNFKYVCYRQAGNGAILAATAFNYITMGS